MAKAMQAKETNTIEIMEVQKGEGRFYILGTSGFLCNAMSEKIKRELIGGSTGRKTKAAQAAAPKHNPIEEYRSSFYRPRKDDCPTAIVMKATAIKAAIIGAALDIPGTNKKQMGRLLSITSDEIPIFGIPQLHMSVTRMANINRTPDIRTRAIVPAWCSTFDLTWTEPLLNGTTITKLLAMAGMTQGIGDWRIEKGSGDYGGFRVVSEDDPMLKLIMESGGKDAQLAAIEDPGMYDPETEDLYNWHKAEMLRRGFKLAG